MNVKLFDHQKRALDLAYGHNRVALYHDCGLGKSFSGAELLDRFGNNINLVVCQKSMIGMWKSHFEKYYPKYKIILPTKCSITKDLGDHSPIIFLINYDMLWRRPEFLAFRDFTLLLDESSLIQHYQTKRTKFVLKLKPKNVILLSGTPCGGKYENLLSQCKLLGWKITKNELWEKYVIYDVVGCSALYPIRRAIGYKNIDNLKAMLEEHGAQFLKTEAVLDSMPEQNFTIVSVPSTREYKEFRKNKIIKIGDNELVGDIILKQILYERMLCGQWNNNKFEAFSDIIDGTNDRVVVFYNFNEEMEKLAKIAMDAGRPISLVNGSIKSTDNFDTHDNGIIFVQFSAGSMGLNLQAANKMIFFSLTLSCEKYQQAQKRIHRIGQKLPCFYYILETENSIEQWIKSALDRGIDFTEELFKEKQKNQTKV